MITNIVVDSGCDVSQNIINSETCGISYVPITLQLGDSVYLDDDNLNIEDYLTHMEKSTEGVKTAAPSPGAFLEAYKKADNVFVVTISSKLSATYQSAMLAKNMYIEEYGEKFIHIFDSLSASVGQGVIAMKIAELVKSGLPNLEVVNQVNSFIKEIRTFFVLDKFDNLVKTGRVKPYVAKVASVLNIKPICGDENGEIKMVGKARGFEKAVKRLVQIIGESIPNTEARIVNITHVKSCDRAVALKDELLKNLKVKDVVITECKGVTATFGYRGGIVVAV